MTMPAKLKELVDEFRMLDRKEKFDLLIEYAEKFEPVPERIATRPFPKEHHVERCESDAYIWAEDLPDGTQKYHFAVENPQGLSAKAWAEIMDETLSGAPLEEVAAVPCDVIFDLYGKDISMGKGQGLMAMTDMVAAFARQKLRERDGAPHA